MDQYGHHQQWNHTPRLQLLFLITCMALVVYVCWVQLEYLSVYNETNAKQEINKKELTTTQEQKETIQGQAMTHHQQKITQQEQKMTKEKYKSTQAEKTKINHEEKTEQHHKPLQQQNRKTNTFRKSTTKSIKELKYILFWTVYDMAPFHYFREGQKSFITNNCSWVNCYATANKTLFNGDLEKFNAIAFNGRVMPIKDLPTKRSAHQKYIYVNMESADNFPVCDEIFDNFFNWTSTYKLDSDIPYPYIIIRNKKGDIIGPQTNMRWYHNLSEVDSSLSARLARKTKAAAWFVSHCSSRSGRDQFVKQLQKALERYHLTVDVYGRCGTLECSRNEHNRCTTLLEKDYFFYMSLENSNAEDYATEKLLTALEHDTVPIVLGGSDYSRFLPPGSYIEAKKYDVDELAAYMDELMNDPHKYSQYFTWKSQYTYSDPTKRENVCAVCAAMNEKIEIASVYDNFRKWWHPDYKNRCKNKISCTGRGKECLSHNDVIIKDSRDAVDIHGATNVDGYGRYMAFYKPTPTHKLSKPVHIPANGDIDVSVFPP